MSHVTLVTLGVSDVEASTRFYEHLSWERSTDSVPGVVSFLRGGAVVLGLFGRGALAEDTGTALSDPPGPVTLATNVSAPDAVDGYLRAAEEAGGTVVKPAADTDWGGYSGYFADLDGHLWEVAHNPAWLIEDGRALLGDDPARVPGDDDPAQRLAAFRDRADATGGRPNAELADEVTAIVAAAAARIRDLLDDEDTDKRIAVMTTLSERGMQARPASVEAMTLHAGSTLVSGVIQPDRS